MGLINKLQETMQSISHSNATRKVALWVGTVVGSGLLTLYLQTMWNAPRPYLELSSVEIRHIGEKTAHVSISSDLIQRIARHRYFPDLEDPVRVASIDTATEIAEARDRMYERLASRLDKVLNLLQTRSANLSVDARRQELLSTWYSGGGTSELDDLAKSMILVYEPRLPDRYRQKHPQGQERFSFQIEPGHTVTLDQVDEEGFAHAQAERDGPAAYPAALQEAHVSNILRRLFVYFEPDVLAQFVTELRALMVSDVQESRKLAQDLRDVVSQVQPDRIVATVVVSNLGNRPLPLRTLGVVWLRLPATAGATSSLIPIEMESASSDSTVIIVDGGEARVAVLQSVRTLSELIANHPEFQVVARSDTARTATTPRIKSLFDGGGLTAAIALARAGVTPDAAIVEASTFRPAGMGDRDGLFNALREDKPGLWPSWLRR